LQITTIYPEFITNISLNLIVLSQL